MKLLVFRVTGIWTITKLFHRRIVVLGNVKSFTDSFGDIKRNRGTRTFVQTSSMDWLKKKTKETK